MSQPQALPSSNVLPFPPARAEKEQAGQEERRAIGDASAAIELPPGLRPQRHGSVKGYLIVPLHSGQRSTTTLRIGRPRVLATPPAGEDDRALPDSSGSVSSLALHGLAIAVLLVVLLPVFVLINGTTSWSAIAPPGDNPATEPQATIFLPALSTPTTLKAVAGQHVRFPIAINGTEAVRGGGTIIISRLPPGSTLSAGVPQGQTKWQLKSGEARDLRLLLPEPARDETTLIVQLVADDGHVISDSATILEMSGDRQESIPVRRVKTEVIQPDQEPDVDDSEDVRDDEPSALDSGSDPVPLPSRRPAVAN